MANYSGTSGNDSYWGGSDADRIEGQGGHDYLLGNGGDDEIFGGDGNDNLHGGDQNDLLEGGAGDDSLQGNDGNDIVRGQAGNDRILLSAPVFGGIAGDSVDGGDDIDTLQFDGLFLSTQIVFSVANPSVAQNLAGATVVNVERLSFRSGSGNDDITGGAFDDYIDGFDGNDRIDGGLGNDTLSGGGGTDTLYGGGGNDIFYGSANNMLYGGDGDDTFRWAGDTLIDGGAGNDKLTAEYYYYGENPPAIIADLSNPNVETMLLGTRVTGIEQLSLTVGGGDDRLTGGIGDDHLAGNGGNDILIGGTGNDILSGGDGNDQLSGGAGDDYLHNVTSDPNPVDSIDGGEGFDTLEYRVREASGPVTIDLLAPGMVTNVEQISFSAWNGSGANTVSGGDSGDTMIGGGGGDVFNGRGGNDDLRGEAGDDVILGGGGDDYITGGSGGNWLEGGDGDDFVHGQGTEANHVDGGAGDDQLFGGEGADSLIGGAGADWLEGWQGADIFVYSQFSDSTDAAQDRIVDFLSGTDKIDLRGLGRVTVAWQAATDPFTGESYQRVTATSSSGSLVLRVDSPGLQSSDFLTSQSATEGDDNLVGTDGDDVIDGLGGNDRIDGLLGADQLSGGAGDDVIAFSAVRVSSPAPTAVGSIDGGSGFDTVDLSQVWPVQVGVSEGGALSIWVGSQRFSVAGIEKILLGGAADTVMLPEDRAQALEIRGGAGNDSFFGSGAYSLYGEQGDDDFFISGTFGPARTGRVDGGEGRDLLRTNIGFTVDLQAGTASAYSASYVIAGIEDVAVSLSGYVSTVSGDGGVNRFSVMAYGDDGTAGAMFDGRGGDDILTGSAGADRLDGGAGNDSLTGRAGNDIYVVDSAGDIIVEAAGEGIDEVRTSLAVYTLGAELENLTGISAGAQTLAGNGLANFVSGGGGNDILRGAAGNDTLHGNGGDDRLETAGTGLEAAHGGVGFDTLVVDHADASTVIAMTFPTGSPSGGYAGSLGDGAGRQVDYSGIEAFIIATGSGNDLIRGGGNFNIVNLGGGDDAFHGTGGNDTVDGGTGVDGVSAALGLAASPVFWNLQTNSYSGPIGSYTNFEYFVGILTGSANDTIVTTSANLNDTVSMGAGDDVATVINGQDHASGEFGNDLLIIDYSASTNAITTTGGAGGITLGSDSSGVSGQIGDGGSRRVNFFNIDRFDVRTGSGNDNIVLGTGSLATSDIVSLGGGDDSVDFGRGIDVGDGGSGVDGLAADISLAGVPISINLVANSFSGPAGISFVNFEYFGGSGFHTGQGSDTVVTGMGDRGDLVALGQGNDSVTLYDGQDSVFGGLFNAGSVDSGLDTLILDYGAATNAVHNVGPLQSNGAGAFGQIGDDSTRLATFQAIDRFLVTTGSGNDTIATAGGNDEIRTGGGTDTLSAGGGDDLLDGGAGADSMAGGAGNDLYFVDNAADTVSENAGEGTDEVRTGLAVYVLAAHVETLTGTSATGQVLTGNAANNLVNAGSGNDVLHLWAGGGDDTVNAGAGNDNIFFGATLTSADVVSGGAGVDTLVVQGPYGSLTLTANITQIENVSILGGNNTNFGEPGTNRYDYVLTTHDANFAAGVQARINGAALLEGEDFTFDGSAETDASYVVYGGKGRDTLLGGLGNDIFFYAEERFASGDTVNGGAGYDGMFLRGNYTIDFNAPGYTGLFTNIENLTLTSATDERYARGGGTEFDYNLTLSDAIVGAGQQLTVSGALLMASETMILDASQETDGMLRLFGGAAADTLKGGALADFIHGNFGADILAGGGGADVFRYQAVTESYSVAWDHITDFTPGTDKIELDRIDADQQILGGDQAFTWIGSNAFTGSAGQLRATQSGGQWIVEGDINGDGYADLVIALTLQGPTPLGAGDFVL